MKKLGAFIKEYDAARKAIGHFNISDIVALKAIAAAAAEVKAPVIIGTSEGEAGFLGREEAVALVRTLREHHKLPIFINSDHTHSLEEVKRALQAGYDAILFDGSKLPLEENIKLTKEVVNLVKKRDKNILVEGELGYIGSSSEVFEKPPQGAALRPEEFTSIEDATRFVKETKVSMLAPAVGNIHGMFAHGPNPSLDIERIRALKAAVKIPLVLHGGSGVTDDDFRKAIKAGIAIVHINTEIRVAWRRGLEEALRSRPAETTPYKLLDVPLAKVKEVVYNRLHIFKSP